MSGPHSKSSQKIGTTLSQADDLHSVNYYDDPTGAPVPSSYKMRRGYSSLTTSKSGQHVHNYPYDPSNTDSEAGTVAPEDLRDTVQPNDFWVDNTPEEPEE